MRLVASPFLFAAADERIHGPFFAFPVWACEKDCSVSPSEAGYPACGVCNFAAYGWADGISPWEQQPAQNAPRMTIFAVPLFLLVEYFAELEWALKPHHGHFHEALYELALAWVTVERPVLPTGPFGQVLPPTFYDVVVNGANGPITGVVANLEYDPSFYKIIVYLGITYPVYGLMWTGPVPTPTSSYGVAGGGCTTRDLSPLHLGPSYTCEFIIPDWANHMNYPVGTQIALFLVPNTYDPPQLANVTSLFETTHSNLAEFLVAYTTVDNPDTIDNGLLEDAVSGAAYSTLALPPIGANTPITGTITGLPNPTGYKVRAAVVARGSTKRQALICCNGN
jgi:hypothetical protein